MNTTLVYDADKLNSATKYPSILTYHAMDAGRLTPEVTTPFTVDYPIVTEKVDGCNARLILLQGEYVIGSRGELLYWSGDRLYGKDQGIVDALRPLGDRLKGMNDTFSGVIVLYFEVYGGKINGYKQYTGSNAVGYKMFDAWDLPRWFTRFLEDRTVEELAQWRDANPYWYAEGQLMDIADKIGVDTTPRLAILQEMPTTIEDTAAWLEQFRQSYSTLDDGAKGCSEGVVIRDHTRSKIAKLRFEDYAKVMRKGGK